MMTTAIVERLSLSRKNNTWVDFCEGESKKTKTTNKTRQSPLAYKSQAEGSNYVFPHAL